MLFRKAEAFIVIIKFNAIQRRKKEHALCEFYSSTFQKPRYFNSIHYIIATQFFLPFFINSNSRNSASSSSFCLRRFISCSFSSALLVLMASYSLLFCPPSFTLKFLSVSDCSRVPCSCPASITCIRRSIPSDERASAFSRKG